MDSLQATLPSVTNISQFPYSKQNTGHNQLVIDKVLNRSDEVSINFANKYKGLTITAQEIVRKLNELLKDKVPNGLESLNPEEHTAEATATRIVQGATAFYQAFAKQNPGLEDQELLDKFMDTLRSGIQKGYDEAYNTLEGLGAFGVEGVKEGVEETKILIESKLQAFYESKQSEIQAAGK